MGMESLSAISGMRRETVRGTCTLPDAPVLALPHPSPRNNGWLKRHPWFESELLPLVRARVATVLAV